MKNRSILSILAALMFLLAFSISAGAVEGILVGSDGLPLAGYSNIYVVDGKALPIYNYAEHAWYDVFVVGTDEKGTPICHVVPRTRVMNERGMDKEIEIHVHHCFSGSTLVKMADGSTKMIKDIAVGEKVMGYDVVAGRFTSCEVVDNYSSVQSNYYILNGGLKVTEGHPFYAKNFGPTPASTRPTPMTTIMTQELKPYATLYGFSTSKSPAIDKITLTSIVHVNEPGTFYDLQVDGTRNFFVSPDGRYFTAVTIKNR